MLIPSRLELTPVPSPFGVAVTVDGHPRFRLVAIVTGLPEAATLGGYTTTFVAWTTTLVGGRKAVG